MKEIIQQLINQIEGDQSYSINTKVSYKSDLKELIDYVLATNTKITDINQSWVKNYLRHLEETNKERNSYNRRASTFRLFLKHLYKNKLAPTNYSLIVDNQSTILKLHDENKTIESLKIIIQDTRLKTDERLILLLIGRLKLSATQIASINTFQIDFENKSISLSDTEKLELPNEIFTILREYLLEVRSQFPGANEHLSLFLNEKGKPITEVDIYKLIKKLREEFNLHDELTTRSLKKLSEYEDRINILDTQNKIFITEHVK